MFLKKDTGIDRLHFLEERFLQAYGYSNNTSTCCGESKRPFSEKHHGLKLPSLFSKPKRGQYSRWNRQDFRRTKTAVISLSEACLMLLKPGG